GAGGASLIFGLKGPETRYEINCVFQVRRESVGFNAANTLHIAHRWIIRSNDPAIIFQKRSSLGQESVEAANQMVPSSIATVERHFTSRTGQHKRFRPS